MMLLRIAARCSWLLGFGKMAGGARAFVLPNLSLDQLRNVNVRVVP